MHLTLYVLFSVHSRTALSVAIGTEPCGPLRAPPPACQEKPDEGRWLAVRTALVCGLDRGAVRYWWWYAGPHKQGLWVAVASG